MTLILLNVRVFCAILYTGFHPISKAVSQKTCGKKFEKTFLRGKLLDAFFKQRAVPVT